MYVFIYIFHSLPWSFGIPCEILSFSTAPSTSILTFETEETSAPCANAATSGSVIWIFLHLTHTHTHIYIYILQSLPWSFGIPCEIFLFSTAPSTSILTLETEEISAPCASAATSGSVIRIFLHLTHTHTYIYIYITFATLVFWHSMWNLLILHSAFHLYTYVRNRGNKCALCECRHFR